MKKLLLVDDNDKYASILREHFEKLEYTIFRAKSGIEAFEILNKNGIEYFNVILTDITMETRLAGLSFLSKVKKMNYSGTIAVASTGLDFRFLVFLSRLCLGIYGVDYLIPKTTVIDRNFKFIPVSIFGPSSSIFEEVAAK